MAGNSLLAIGSLLCIALNVSTVIAEIHMPPSVRRGLGSSADDVAAGEDMSLEEMEATIPIIPYCRKGHIMGVVLDRRPASRAATANGPGTGSKRSGGVDTNGADTSLTHGVPRIALFGGKGKDYVAARKGTRTLNDVWLLNIYDNMAFEWEMMSPSSENILPIRRWKANSAEHNGSLYVFGGDRLDPTINFFGDLWRFSVQPHTQPMTFNHDDHDDDDNDDKNGDNESNDSSNDDDSTTATTNSVSVSVSAVDAEERGLIEAETDTVTAPTPSPTQASTADRGMVVAPGWEQIQTTGDPLGRRGHVMTIFSSGRLVIMGGKHKDYDAQNEHLAPCLKDVHYVDLNSTDKEWMQGAEFPKLCRWGATGSGIVDPEDGQEKLAVFGGRILVKEYEEYIYFNEMWYYNPANDSWAEKFPVKGEIPRPRDHHSSVYIAEMQSLFIYGGRYTYQRVPALDDVWQYDLTKHVWTHLVPSTEAVPPSRYMPDMVVWRGNDGTSTPVLVIFGGEHFYNEGDGDNTKLNDVWVFRPHTRAWHQVSDGGCKQGADGVPFQPIIGVGTLAIVAAIVLAAGLVMAVVVLARSYIRMRPGYTSIN